MTVDYKRRPTYQGDNLVTATELAALTSGSNREIGTSSAHALLFKTDNVERARIESSGIFRIGSGDALTLYDTTAWDGQRLDIRKGTSGSPDTAGGPLLKVHRTLEHTVESLASLASNPASDWADGLAAIHGQATSTAASEVQPVGVLGVAASYGSDDVATPGPKADGAGLYGVGRAYGDGRGIGIFAVGRVESGSAATAGGQGAEIALRNGGASDDTTLNLTGADRTMVAWLHGSSGRRVGTGIKFGNPFGGQMGTGIHFNNQSGTNALAGTTTGPTVNYDIRSDSSAATGILIGGTHSTAALAIALGSGPLLVGADDQKVAGTYLEVAGDATAGQTPTVLIGSTAGQFLFSQRIRNSAGSLLLGLVGAAGQLLTGTAVADGVLQTDTTNKAIHIGGTTKVVSVSRANGLGFHAVTPIAQPTGYTTPTNRRAALKTLNANTATLAQVIDVLNTITEDVLKAYGLIGA